MTWYPNPKTRPETTGAAQWRLGLALQASQNKLTVKHGPAMHDRGSRWNSGLSVQALPRFLAFS